MFEQGGFDEFTLEAIRGNWPPVVCRDPDGLVGLAWLLSAWAGSRSFPVGFVPGAWIFLGVLALVGVLPRTRNIGMHPVKALFIFVPIANLILAIRCLAYQEGYEATRKLDKTGKIIAAIIAIVSMIGYGYVFFSAI